MSIAYFLVTATYMMIGAAFYVTFPLPKVNFNPFSILFFTPNASHLFFTLTMAFNLALPLFISPPGLFSNFSLSFSAFFCCPCWCLSFFLLLVHFLLSVSSSGAFPVLFLSLIDSFFCFSPSSPSLLVSFSFFLYVSSPFL